MNPAALGGVDPDDLTPDQRFALYAQLVLDRESERLAVTADTFEAALDNAVVEPRA